MDDNDNITAIKVVLLGEAGVGKTSIINSFIKRTFSSDINSTPGATFVSKTLLISEKEEIKFEIWDTAGQEKFRSITRLFYKNASVIIMVYDITQKKSFEELKKYWYDAIKTNSASTTLLALVGNKCDMYGLEEISEKEAKEYAKSINATFKLTSAKNAQGIDDLFESIGKRYLDPKYVDSSCLSNEEKEKSAQKNVSLNKPIAQLNKKTSCKC